MVKKVGGFEETFRRAFIRFEMYEDQAFLAKVYINGAGFHARVVIGINIDCMTDSCVSVMPQAGQKY